jgi:hypothetical protein
LALLGPLAGNSNFMAMHGPGDYRRVEPARRYRPDEADYRRRWLVIQGLDWVRRAVLGQLESPVDWQ